MVQQLRKEEQPDAPPQGGGPLGPRETGNASYINRELSWLEFNRRVLALAEDRGLPLLERVKFAAIFSSNLDEFFQVRVAGLKAQVEAGVGTSFDGRTPEEQLSEIRARVLNMVRQQEDLFLKELLPALAEERVRLARWDALSKADREYLSSVFDEEILPVLTPLSVDPVHPFPHISNLSLNLAVVVRDPATDEHRFARLKVPGVLERVLFLPDGERFVPVEHVIAAHLDACFPGMEIVSHYAFRVTLDAELSVEEEEAGDLLSAIESGLHRRLRMNDVVRLEIEASMSSQIRELLMRELEIGRDDIYELRGPLDLSGLWALYALDRPDLKSPVWHPVTPGRLRSRPDEPADIFATLRAGDVLVHHPYESFQTSVEAFLRQAADDPDVLAIKHTLYRTSGPDNPLVHALIRAAKSGKEVVALIEVRARFDEESNVEWARSLEQVGVHVVYGLVGLKTHGKIALVVRREGDTIRRYCHLGTGNYNPTTARSYEDVGLLTASPVIGADVAELFNHLTGCSRPSRYRKLLVAPATLRDSLLSRIEAEIRKPAGRIVFKMNSLADPDMIDALYRASQAGVEIDLIVRGICCLRPGVPGVSERIRVRSILGEFLEHSRIYRFGEDQEAQYFIGSADLMTRNLDNRVEVLTPVEEPAQCERLEEVLQVNLSDDGFAWVLGAYGRWRRVEGRGERCAQSEFKKLARERCLPEGERG
jgi:polyphosphate kinase